MTGSPRISRGHLGSVTRDPVSCRPTRGSSTRVFLQVGKGAACGNRTHDLRITRAPDSADPGRYLRLCCRRLLLRRLCRRLWTVVRVTTRVTNAYRRVWCSSARLRRTTGASPGTPPATRGPWSTLGWTHLEELRDPTGRNS